MCSFQVCLLVAILATINLDLKLCEAKIEGKIINGYSVDIRYFPFMASIQVDGGHICGGAVVSANLIVTAAHCNVYEAVFYEVRLGSTYYDRDGLLLNVTEAISHPKYNRKNADYDVAVFKLSQKIDFNRWAGAIVAIKLPPADYVFSTGLGVTVLGWGTTDPHDATGTSVNLRSASLRVITNSDCIKMFPPNSLTDRMVCAQNFDMDACTGDSGGPMVGRSYLLGVISWGMGCNDKQYPGVYTSVPKVLDFIQGYLK